MRIYRMKHDKRRDTQKRHDVKNDDVLHNIV